VAEYARHEPEKTLLHRVVRQQLEPFLARAARSDQPAPRFIEQELRSYLRCGVLAHGFIRVHCDACGHDRLVAFSCKRRGFCPSCGGRRMADTAAQLVDRALPETPIRHWVLTLPHPLRYRCAYDAKLTSEVLRAFIRALFAELRRRARRKWNFRAEQCGAVTFIQRFGSALNLNLHFHTLAIDGVYRYALDPDRLPRFVPLPPPDPDEVSRVLAGIARRIRRVLETIDDEDALARDEPLLALLAAASVRTRIATGPHGGEPWRRVGDRVEARDPVSTTEVDPEDSNRVPRLRGMSLHAGVAVPATDRKRLERLCRYVARPPIASERLEECGDGVLTLRLKTPWRDGTTHILMKRAELIERLVPLIPPPRAHQVRYHGILASSASLRARITPAQATPAADSVSPRSQTGTQPPAKTARSAGIEATTSSPVAQQLPNRAPAGIETLPSVECRRVGEGSHADLAAQTGRMPWAALLQRVFAVDALRCPDCGSAMRLVAAIEDPAVARRILEGLQLPARAPPLGDADPRPDASQHPLDDASFDQSPRYEEP